MSKALMVQRAGAAPVALSGDQLAARVAQAQHDGRGAFSASTVATYGAGVSRFAGWCDETGRSYGVPVDPRDLAAFVDDMAKILKPASVSNYVSGITAMHRALDIPSPADTSVVRLALKRMRRAAAEKGQGAQKQAKPMQRKLVDAALARLGDAPADLRDAALISLAYDTMCRASELVALNLSHIQRSESGAAAAYIARSKTDQDGEGQYRYVAPDTLERVAAWAMAWELSGDDPLFPPLSHAARGERISTRDVSRIYKRRVGEKFTAHSTRVGAAVDQLAANQDVAKIMQAGGWSSPVMVGRYTKALAVEKGAAAEVARLQGRA